jgi:hypothetical protein
MCSVLSISQRQSTVIAETYICIVTPHARRSLTRNTLLITSRPRSSNTSIFHMGFPSSSRMGADVEVVKPLLLACESAWELAGSCAWFKFRIFAIEPAESQSPLWSSISCVLCTYESVARGETGEQLCLPSGQRKEDGEQAGGSAQDSEASHVLVV